MDGAEGVVAVAAWGAEATIAAGTDDVIGVAEGALVKAALTGVGRAVAAVAVPKAVLGVIGPPHAAVVVASGDGGRDVAVAGEDAQGREVSWGGPASVWSSTFLGAWDEFLLSLSIIRLHRFTSPAPAAFFAAFPRFPMAVRFVFV